MKKISEKTPLAPGQSKVARYIDFQLQAIAPKTVGEIATEAGLPQRNLLSMIRTGATKLPFERIASIARALKVDPYHLFRLALQEYQPHINEMMDAAGQQAVSECERQLLAVWREASGDTDPPVEPVKFDVARAAEHARGFVNEAAALAKGRPRWGCD